MKKRNPAHTYDDQRLSYEMLQIALSNASAKLTVADRRLDRIATLHGVIGNLCNQCGEPIPCPTRVALTEFVAGADADANIKWPGM